MDTWIFITLRTFLMKFIMKVFMIYKDPKRKLFLNENKKFSELKHLSN